MGDIMPYVSPTTCPTCGGSGHEEDDLCLTCFGGGVTPVRGVLFLTAKGVLGALNDVMNKCNDLEEKVDEIKTIVDEL